MYTTYTRSSTFSIHCSQKRVQYQWGRHHVKWTWSPQRSRPLHPEQYYHCTSGGTIIQGIGTTLHSALHVPNPHFGPHFFQHQFPVQSVRSLAAGVRFLPLQIRRHFSFHCRRSFWATSRLRREPLVKDEYRKNDIFQDPNYQCPSWTNDLNVQPAEMRNCKSVSC